MTRRRPLLLRLALTPGEALELRRALVLIAEEDGACNVNMSPREVADKASALAKLTRLTGRSRAETMMDSATSISINDIMTRDRTFGEPDKK